MKLIYDLSGIDEVAKLIIAQKKFNTFIFKGEMGAGKTTLITALCKFLGVEDGVCSPSFGLVNEYEGDTDIIYHFDFYRIESESEAYDLGFEEYEYTGDFLFIEWAERIPNLIPKESHLIEIKLREEDLKREIFIS